MPQLNYTIDNVDPLIQYLPAGIWYESSAADPNASLYFHGTLTTCVTANASASFSFNGTAVWIFGSKRANHGLYTVDLDGTTTQGNGFDGNGQFQFPLFNATGLKQGVHTVTISNIPLSDTLLAIDVDYITWTSSIGDDSEAISTTTVEDTDASFSYQPPASWGTDGGNFEGFSGGSGHATVDKGSVVSYTFSGDGVSLYGAVGPSVAPYDVVVDGRAVGSYNATKAIYTPQVVLYHADNLGPGNHTVQLVNQAIVLGQVLSIDFATTYNVPSVATVIPSTTSSSSISSGTSSAVPNSASPASVAHTKLQGGAIGGIAAGAAVLLIILAVALSCLWRRRRAFGVHNNRSHGSFDVDDKMIAPAAGYPETAAIEFGSHMAPTETTHLYPNRPALAATGASTVNTSELTSLITPSPDAAVLYPVSVAHVDEDAQGPRASRKGLTVLRPPTAGQPSFLDIPETELRAQRRVEEGRAQDFGPLPPSYVQAIEPLHR